MFLLAQDSNDEFFLCIEGKFVSYLSDPPVACSIHRVTHNLALAEARIETEDDLI